MSQHAKFPHGKTADSTHPAEPLLQMLSTFFGIVASSSNPVEHQRAAQKALTELKQLRNCPKKPSG